jgi:RNA 3'-terminal phosphate cyclase (ATP)
MATTNDWLIIDGGFGEGGGQIPRSALALAGAVGRRVRVEKIRAKRPKPGLRPQHVAAARAVAEVCGGELRGAKSWGMELEFAPGTPRAGRYSFAVGTAGSTTLVLQTILPVLGRLEAGSTVSIGGGTHNPLAPPAEFIAESFLPLLRRIGYDVELELARHGFAPKGGGEIKARIGPYRPGAEPLMLLEPVDWGEPSAVILITNLPDHVAFREKDELTQRLRLDPERVRIEPLPGELGPGNAVMVRYQAGDRVAIISAFGEPHKSAERVAQEAAREAKNFSRGGAPVDPHLADQLLVPLALGPGGEFLTSAVTEHARTQAHLLKIFLGLDVGIEMLAPERFKITVPGKGF